MSAPPEEPPVFELSYSVEGGELYAPQPYSCFAQGS